MGGSSDGCECVPMVLMQMVMTQQMVGMRADTRGAEVFEDESVKVGKKTCTCDFSFTMAGNKVKKALGTCDKKCSGNAKRLRDARRFRNARRRIRPLRMCLRPYAQRHGRFWNAPNATNRVRIRNWTWIWIWCHTSSSHR